MLSIGHKAPLFHGESTKGMIQLEDYIGKQPIVIIFYPKDDTMICTKQLCAVQDSKAQYAQFNTVVLGVNPGSLEGHKQFSAKFLYDFPLISDMGMIINQMYGVGSQFFGLYRQHRVVYVINLKGNITYARKGNRPTKEILAALEVANAKV